MLISVFLLPFFLFCQNVVCNTKCSRSSVAQSFWKSCCWSDRWDCVWKNTHAVKFCNLSSHSPTNIDWDPNCRIIINVSVLHIICPGLDVMETNVLLSAVFPAMKLFAFSISGCDDVLSPGLAFSYRNSLSLSLSVVQSITLLLSGPVSPSLSFTRFFFPLVHPKISYIIYSQLCGSICCVCL